MFFEIILLNLSYAIITFSGFFLFLIFQPKIINTFFNKSNTTNTRGGLMKEYSLKEALKIFCNVDESTIVHVKFHFHVNNHKRHSNPNMWTKVFFKHELLGIMKQEENKFKLCYKHPSKNQKDLYLIIVINDDNSMDLITTYEGNISRRTGINEWR